MKEKNDIDILKRNGLSITDSRKKILGLFYDNAGALAHADIENEAGSNFDRVTIYRTLQSFVEKGIIHQIPTTDNTILYALCKQQCSGGHHHDNHVHFICSQCEKTICLDDVLVPEVKLPRGFKPAESAMTVKGTCKECRS